MKNIILVFVFILSVISLNAQESKLPKFKIGVGITTISNFEYLKPSSVGLKLDLDIKRLHFDFNSNLKGTKGDYLDFSYYKTDKAHEKAWVAFNIGFISWLTNIYNDGNLYLVVKVGVLYVDHVYEHGDYQYIERYNTLFSRGIELQYINRTAPIYYNLGYNEFINYKIYHAFTLTAGYWF